MTYPLSALIRQSIPAQSKTALHILKFDLVDSNNRNQHSAYDGCAIFYFFIFFIYWNHSIILNFSFKVFSFTFFLYFNLKIQISNPTHQLKFFFISQVIMCKTVLIQVKWSSLPVLWQTQPKHIEYTEEFSFFLLLLLFSEDLATLDIFAQEAGTQSVHWWREQYQESISQVYQCLLQKKNPKCLINCSDPNFQEKPRYLPHQEVYIFQVGTRLDTPRAWETFPVMAL